MIRIGKIVASHGLKGTLILTHLAGNSKWLKVGSVLLVEMNKGSYIPYIVSTVKANNESEYYINIEDIETVEKAKPLVTKTVYVDEDILSKYIKNLPLLWTGFTIIDSIKGDIGKIADVYDTGTQYLAKINYGGSEALIPLVEQMIVSLDIKSKTLNMNLPEGLLEVYLK